MCKNPGFAAPANALDPSSPRDEFLAGSREVAPALVGTIPFGLVTGIAAVAAGMTPAQGIALSFFAFSGIAQLVTTQLVAAQSPLLLTVAAAFVVSLRLLMYSAALSPHLAHLDRRWRVLLSYLMTDQSFASTVRRYSDPGDKRHRHWHFLGSALTLFVTWQLAVIAGVVAIVAPGLLMPQGVLDFTLGNPRLFAGILAIAVAARTRSVLAATVAGMGALWLLQWSLG